jgi:hypothetical protein
MSKKKKGKQFFFVCPFCEKRKRQPEDEDRIHYGVCHDCAEEHYYSTGDKFEGGTNDGHTSQH